MCEHGFDGAAHRTERQATNSPLLSMLCHIETSKILMVFDLHNIRQYVKPSREKIIIFVCLTTLKPPIARMFNMKHLMSQEKVCNDFKQQQMETIF